MTTNTNNILLIDDDERLAEMIKEYLENEGYSVTSALDGESGLELHQQNSFRAIILDLMLPDIGGLEICQTIRKTDAIPILVLSAKGDPLDRILGLEMGADDYLPKPFEPRELLARLRAILRRGDQSNSHNIIRFGNLEIDKDMMEARLNGKRCDLTVYQFQLLTILSEAAGRVLTRDQLMNSLQGSDLEAFDRSIDVHISRIRAEIETDPKHPQRVITVRGVGYLFTRAKG